MAKLSKRMKAIAAKIDREKSYSVDDAVKLLNEVANDEIQRVDRRRDQSRRRSA